MANTIVKLPDNLKSSLINGENPVVGNAQQGESQLQRLNERTPKYLAKMKQKNKNIFSFQAM